MRVRAEFTTEPFVGEGQMPEHVTHSAALLTEAGLDADLGPFGTSVEGEDTILVPALTNVLAAALAAGATRVTLQLERVDTEPRIDHATTDHTATDHTATDHTATDHDGATL